MRRALVAVCLVMLFSSVTVLAQEGTPSAPWWNKNWNRRAAIVLASPGAAIAGVPVIIYGHALQELAGGEAFSTGSLRVIAPQGEVPCQYDECDGTGVLVTASNHELDADDELCFQADLPAQGQVVYWLYWNTTPIPPGKYEVTARVHDPVEPTAFLGDVQFHNRACLIGMKGPGTGEDPTKNDAANHGNGAVTFVDFFHHGIIRGGWGSYFPQGGLFAGPGTEIKKWQLPRQIAWGPVRCGASVVMPEGNLPLGQDQTARVKVEHRTWLYDRGAWVMFEEIFTPLEPIARLGRSFNVGFALDPAGTYKNWSSIEGEPFFAQPTAEEIAEAAETNKIIWGGNTDDWLSQYRPADRLLLSAVINQGQPLPGETRQGTSYGRTNLNLRNSLVFTNLAANQPIYRRFWYTAMQGEFSDGAVANAIPLALSPRGTAMGPVEKAR